jgi:Zn-dependent membrane protease YugP
MFFDPLYILLILLPSILIGVVIQNYVRRSYKEFSRIRNRSGYTGRDVALSILESNGIHNVSIRQIQGVLTDNYNPLKKELNLSEGVYAGNSIASACIAAHESGHVIQDKRLYTPLQIRNAILPVVNFGNIVIWPLILIGFLIRVTFLIDIGIIFFIGIVLFHFITLPVEFNASTRAIAALKASHILTENEIPGARKVLNAAALTYVASALIAVMNLVYFLLLRGRR